MTGFIHVASITLHDFSPADLEECLERGGLHKGVDFVRGPHFDHQITTGRAQLMFKNKDHVALAERLAWN